MDRMVKARDSTYLGYVEWFALVVLARDSCFHFFMTWDEHSHQRVRLYFLRHLITGVMWIGASLFG